LGGSVRGATLDGTQTRVKVPEGTQNGRQFRLKGKGMPVLRQPQIGDLYIQTSVETPQNLSKRQRELLEEFDKLSSKENSPQSSGFFSRMKEFLRVVRR
jgi:molecular chaperone DnaJ